MIGRNLPNSMARPREVWNQSLVTVRPPKALPLLLAADVYAYRTSLNPWTEPGVPGSPLLPCASVVDGSAALTPLPISTSAGMTST